MKKFLIVPAMLLALTSCQRRVDVTIPDCPEEKGYGIQSNVALCSEIVYETCELTDRCSEKDVLQECLFEGLALCATFYEGISDHELIYEKCVPEVRAFSCEQFAGGANFPESCLEAFVPTE